MRLFPSSTGDFQVEKGDLANLDMLELARYFSLPFQNQEEIAEFLGQYLSADAAELKNRQAVLQALRTVGQVEEKLERLTRNARALIQKIGRLAAERTASVLIFCNTGQSALSDYLKLVDEYQALLAACPQAALQDERAALDRLLQSDRYRGAQAVLEEIQAAYAGFQSIDIGCNVNGFGEVNDFGIIGFNQEQEPLRSLLSDEPGKAICVAAHIPYPRVGALAELEAHFHAGFERRFHGQLRSIGRLLDQVDFQGIAAWAEQIHSLQLYQAALSMIQRYQSQGCPVCVPVYLDDRIQLEAVSYPHLSLQGRPAVPVSAALPRAHIALVTGPNHSGKTSFLKSLAQCVLLSHLGMMVPAEAFATPIYHQVITLFSAGEENGSNQSRYELELTIIRKMYERSDSATLLLFNEPLTATNPEEAVPILADLLSRMVQRGCTQLVVTHYYEVYDRLMAQLPDQVSSFITETAIEEGQIRYGYRVQASAPKPQRYAHMIAEKYGLTAERILQDKQLAALIHAYLETD